MSKRKEILIVGGGVAGLSTGIYGQMNAYNTTVLEMHSISGGVCTAWDRKGYRFDYCLHWLIGTRFSAFNTIWKETGVIDDTVEIVDNKIHNINHDDKHGDFIIYTNIDEWEAYLLDMAPEDEKAIRKMCGHMKLGIRIEPFEHCPEARSAMHYIRALMKMKKLLFLLSKYSSIPAKDYFKKLGFKNEKLKYFLNKLYGEADYSALVVIMMLGWFHAKNAGYLVGGSLALSRRMAERYESLGGQLSLKSKVKKILVKEGKAFGVELVDGRILHADIVISAADGHSTLFDMLDGKYISPQLEKAYSSWELFTPFIQISFGVNADINHLCHGTWYIKDNFKIGGLTVKHGYSITVQTVKDNTLAPEGKSTLLIRIDSDWDDWSDMTDEDYKLTKERLKEDGIKLLTEHYPELIPKIEVIDVATPRTCVDYTGVWKASYEGFLPVGNMVKKTLKSTLPNLNNFYMVGQWMFPGGGIPPAAQSGKWIIEKICLEDKKKFVTKHS